MKRLTLLFLTFFSATLLYSQQKQPLKYIEASEFTMVGKLFPDTPNPYHRVDTMVHKGFTEYENFQVRMSAGIAVSFRTDSKIIAVKADYGEMLDHRATCAVSERGFDLYARVDGKWIWAAANAHRSSEPEVLEKTLTLIRDMDGQMREYLLYLPIFSELNSLKIVVDQSAEIEAAPIPFKGRVAMFGSSFTHGSSTTRSSMTYPAQLARMTGYQFLSLGCGGNSKLQPYFAEALAAADVDAFVFDAFSNPSAELIEERLFPFIDIIRKSHPDTPLIFVNTLYRSSRHFSTKVEAVESAKRQMAEKMMKECVKRYADVYWINTADCCSPEIETTTDGIHPSDYGYFLLAGSISDQVRTILDKYIK